MPTLQAEVPFGKFVRTSQIIIAALLMGPLPVLAIALLIGPLAVQRGGGAAAGAAARAPGPPDDALALIFNGLVIAFGSLAIVMSFILPRVVSANGRKAAVKRSLVPNTAGVPGKGAKLQAIEEARVSLLPQFNAQLIVGAAILEGATFFAAVTTLLIGGLIAPGIAIVLMIVLIARFPTEARAQLWLDQQCEKLRDEEFSAAASS
jgi:hypothetical protein